MSARKVDGSQVCIRLHVGSVSDEMLAWARHDPQASSQGMTVAHA